MDAPSAEPGRLGGVITALLTLAGWSSVPLFIEHFTSSIDAWTSNGWRYGFSALLWAPLLLVGLVRRRLPRGLFVAAVIPSVINSAGQVCFTWAHYKIDPGLLTFGLRTHIVFVTIGAAIMFPAERALIGSPRFLIGLVMVVGGTFGTVALGDGLPAGASLLGVLLALASGALFAAYALSVRRCMRGIHPMVAFAAISQYTAGAMLALMFVFGADAGAGALALSSGQFGLLLLSAVIGIALGHVLYYIAIEKLGVAVSAGIVQLQPICVGIASYFLFQEALSAPQWASGLIAVSGAALMLWAQHVLQRRRRIAPDAELRDLPADHVAAAAGSQREAATCEAAP
ncbi:MAG: DMT family transporter [Phycisphaerales bacterium JB039]